MENTKFDGIARALGSRLAAPASRRAGILGLLGAVGASFAPGAGAGGRRGGRGDGRGDGHGPAAAGPCGPTKKANACRKHKDCCTGYCEKKVSNKDGRGRCRCLSAGDACTRKQTCCGSLSCVGGVCGHPAPTPPCTVCAAGCAHATVQAAIDAAAPGGVIDIGGGTYSEDLAIGKDLTLRACHGESVTLKNLTDATRTIVISNTPSVTISGITVTCGTCAAGTGGGISGLANLTLNGATSVSGNKWSGVKGGGILMNAGALTGDYVLAMADDAKIADNVTDTYGGGLMFEKDDSTALTFTVTMDDDASITGNSSSGGGAMKLYKEGRVVMRGNALIDSNVTLHLVDSYDGGAITFYYLEAPAGTTILAMHDASRITNNTADDAGGGVNVTVPDNAVGIIMDGTSEVSGNHAGGDGGGLSLYGTLAAITLTVKDSAAIRNNTAAGNGGGVLLGMNGALVLQGSGSVTGNSAAGGGGVHSVSTGNSVTGGAGVTGNSPDQCTGTGISC